MCGEKSLDQGILDLLDRYINAWDFGDTTAVRHIIDFYGGDGTFLAYPDAVKDKLIGQTATNILDWQAGYASAISMQELTQVRIPTTIISGAKSHKAMLRCNQLLANHLPNANWHVLEGANHFMIGTHPSELLQLIEKQVSGVAPRG
jgi:pimeloyl-ACP methyl ester carboxylesterase